MRTFANIGPRGAVTPQSEPIPDSGQVQNNAGGYAWEIGDWGRLDRFLILGTDGGTYYVKERPLTIANAECVKWCIAADGQRTVARIAEISERGRAPKNDPALLALAMCAALGDDGTRAAAFAALPRVARIGTHLLHFVSYVEQWRGWGRGLRKAVSSWFNDKAPRDLAYQLTKYQSRDKWATRDLLRLAHPVPVDQQHKDLYAWVAQKETPVWSGLATDVGDYMAAYVSLQTTTDPKDAAKLIADHRLAREVVPSEMLKHAVVWEALVQDMPMTALIRNLATLTRVGLIAPMSETTGRVISQLGDAERIRRARVHPIAIFAAMRTYASGKGQRGSNTWTPVTQITDALHEAFYTAFGNVEPANKRTLVAIDVSGSMSGGEVNGLQGVEPCTAAAAMALITAATEPQHVITVFNTQNVPFSVSAKDRIDRVQAQVRSVLGGGTDCSSPMRWALENKVPVDTFVLYTDDETWAGSQHPAQALQKYRDVMGIPAKLVNVGMVATSVTIADPRDAGQLNCVGFDTNVPSIITDFSRN